MTDTLPIVYAYPCRWEQIPGRHRYLMEAMSAHTRVIFLNEPVCRSRWHMPKPRAQRISNTLTVIHDAFGVRFSRVGRRLGRLGAMIDSIWLHDLLGQLGIHEYIYWLSTSIPAFLWFMRKDRFVFDSIDPCFEESFQAEFDRMEFDVARRARVVFCTAESLLDRLKPVNPNAHLLPNACSADEYKPQSLAGLTIPESLRDRPRPIVGYMGTFDWRVDVETLYYAARHLPQFTFALVGRINTDQESRVNPLRELPNVVMPGAVSLDDGRRYTAAFDVGLIPFLSGPMGDGINPVKMYMYLAAGKPVVSTWVRECRRHAPYVNAAKTGDEFVAAIQSSVSENAPPSMEDRVAFAMKNTWQDRAREAMQILRTNGLFESASATRAVPKPQAVSA